MAKKKVAVKNVEKPVRILQIVAVIAVAIILIMTMISGAKVDSLNAKVASLEVQQVNTSAQISNIVQWDNSFAGSVIYTFGEVQNYTNQANARMTAAEYSLKQAGLYRLPPENVTVSLK